MLSRVHRLFFPKLQFIKEDSLIRKSKDSGSGRPINTYRLDWTKQEEVIKKEHEDWKAKYHPTKDLPFIGQLPEEWDTWIKSLVFAIDEGYLREIRYWSQFALNSWNRSNFASADTVVREICLEPAIGMIRVAFFLIGDCTYDPENKWYSRTDKNFLVEHVMSYKFWAYQTGRGLLWKRARLNDLEWCTEQSTTATKNPDDPFIVEGKKLLADIKKHQEIFDKAYDELAIECNDGNMQGPQAK
jgi:hypothetical protein